MKSAVTASGLMTSVFQAVRLNGYALMGWGLDRTGEWVRKQGSFTMVPGTGSLNESQARRLRVTCQHIDDLLSDIEDILNESGSKTAFPRYSPDIAPAKRRAIEDCISRVRASLVGILDRQGIPWEQPPVPASRAIALTLVSIHISVEELKPKYMQGYGDVPAATAKDLNRIVGELHGLVTGFEHRLAGDEVQDFGDS